MIVLDTHIWIWWTQDDPLLPPDYKRYIDAHLTGGVGVSIISCWEIALLDAYGKISLPLPIELWLNTALSKQHVHLLALSPKIVVEANHLPGVFHRDPADRLIVATARIHGYALVTLDGKIRNYPHVQLAP